ncbi:MAG: inositol monophosphatase family protein [Anaerolineae bacterium]
MPVRWRDPLLRPFLEELVREAGGILMRNFGPQQRADKKGVIDLVTQTDLESERLLVGAIRERYPNHRIMAEEGERPEGRAEHLWLIDPLDGTVNYVHGYPAFSITLALRHEDDALIGAVYDPLLDEFYYAERGEGATLNGAPLHVSRADRLLDSLLATGFSYQRASLADNNIAEFSRLVLRVQGIRRAGSAALDLAHVAAGRLDGYWEMHLEPWDWAAGQVLIEEAGGKVTDFGSGPWSPFLDEMAASNGRIHDELLQELAASRKPELRDKTESSS